MGQNEYAGAVYQRLMRAPDCTAAGDGFATHVLACILALSAGDAQDKQCPVAETAGFDDSTLLASIFPEEADWLRQQSVAVLVRSEDELCLIDLLQRAATARTPQEQLLATLIARRAQRPNHLWQDLGLVNRGELTKLMQTHFAPLARRNKADMKWKKFFYRTLCRDAEYSLCMAPSCSECCDFDQCFNEESGESLLAHVRRRADQAA